MRTMCIQFILTNTVGGLASTVFTRDLLHSSTSAASVLAHWVALLTLSAVAADRRLQPRVLFENLVIRKL